MFDNEKLIIAVQKRPFTWKVCDKQYNDKAAKLKAWKEVAAEVFDEWGMLPAEVKEEKVKDVRKKWRNIRDCFIKELRIRKKLKPGTVFDRRKSYRYFNMLRFLTSTETKRPELNEENEQDETSNHNFPEAPIKCEQNSNSGFEIENHMQQNFHYVDNAQAIEPVPFEQRLLSILDSRNSNREEEVDEDKSFLISLLPMMKKLSDQQKLDVKIEMLNIMKKIQYPQNVMLSQKSAREVLRTGSSSSVQFNYETPQFPLSSFVADQSMEISSNKTSEKHENLVDFKMGNKEASASLSKDYNGVNGNCYPAQFYSTS